jgi:hypothetical protein
VQDAHVLAATSFHDREIARYKARFGITGTALEQQIAAAQQARTFIRSTPISSPTVASNPTNSVRTSSRDSSNNTLVEQRGQAIGFTEWPAESYKQHAELQMIVRDPTTNALAISNKGGVCSTTCQPFLLLEARARGERIVVDSPLGTYIFDPDRRMFRLIRYNP